MEKLKLVEKFLKENGMYFDIEGFRSELQNKQQEYFILQKDIRKKLGVEDLNLNDNKAIINALYKNDIYPECLTLEFLIKNNTDNEIYNLLLKEKRLKQFLHQYGERLNNQICKDGRIRSEWKMDGSKTGRMASSNPNLQAFPKITKRYFKPKEGYVYVIGDYGQIELRVLAELSNDIVMLNAFREGKDIHAETASAIFNKSIGNISDIERAVGKKVNFAQCYGVSAYGLRKIIKKEAKFDISLSQANRVISAFYEKYPDILVFHNKLLISKTISSLGGETWSDIKKGDRLRYNLPIQATAAEGLKEALKLLVGELKDEWKLVNVVHDEIVLEVPREDAKNVSILLEKIMILGMKSLLKSVPIEVDIRIQENWDK